MRRGFSSRIALAFGAAAVLLGIFVVVQPSAEALPVHGLGFFKGCTSPTTVGQKTRCNFTITNSFDPDDLTITSLVDVVQAAGGNDSSGNVLATLTWSFSNGASCNAGQTLCTLPKGSK